MANSQEQLQYLRDMLNRKRESLEYDSFVNPNDNDYQLTNDISEMARIKTDFSMNQTAEPDLETKEDNVGSDSWYNQVTGFLNEVGYKLLYGFNKGIEGIADFGANILGALGWEDATEWAKQDISNALAEWYRTYGANLTGATNIVKNFANGNFTNEQYWSDMFNGLSDIAKSMIFAQTSLDHDYREDARKYTQVYDEKGGFDSFALGLVESFGEMLPSIAVGSYVNTLPNMAGNVAKNIGLATFGLAAGGNASEEALNKGATTEQALAYGAIKGGIETATELFVNKGLNGIAKATGLDKVIGKFGNNLNGIKFGTELFAKTTKKQIAIDIGKSMFEEGVEEVVSDIVSPFADTILEGKEALKQYGTADYWKQVGLSFASGAVMGGFSSSVQSISAYNKLGPEGFAIMNKYIETEELQEKYNNLLKKGKTNEEALNQLAIDGSRDMKQVVDGLSQLQEKDPVKFNNLMQMLTGGKTTVEHWATEQGKTTIENIKKRLTNSYLENAMNDFDRRFGRFNTVIVNDEKIRDFDYFKQIYQEKYGKELDESYRSEFESKFSQVGKDSEVGAFTLAGIAIIPSSRANVALEKYLHENFSHAWLDKSPELRNAVVNAIKSTKEGAKLWNEVEASIKKTYKGLVDTEEKLTSETLAHIIEYNTDIKSFFENLDRPILYKIKSVYDSIKRKIANAKGDIQKSAYSQMEYITKILNTAINAYDKAVSQNNKAQSKKESVAFSIDDEEKENGKERKENTNNGNKVSSNERNDKRRIRGDAFKTKNYKELLQEWRVERRNDLYNKERRRRLNEFLETATIDDIIYLINDGTIPAVKYLSSAYYHRIDEHGDFYKDVYGNKIIKKEVYTNLMKNIEEENKKFGVETFFLLEYGTEDLYGFFMPNTNVITVNAFDEEHTNRHEKCHYFLEKMNFDDYFKIVRFVEPYLEKNGLNKGNPIKNSMYWKFVEDLKRKGYSVKSYHNVYNEFIAHIYENSINSLFITNDINFNIELIQMIDDIISKQYGVDMNEIKFSLDEEYNPKQDPFGYVKVDGQTYGVSKNYNKIFDYIDGFSTTYEDYYVGETDYRDAYLSKKFVNKIEGISSKLNDFLEDVLEIDVEDAEEKDYQFVKEIYEKYASNEDFIENLQTIVDEVDSCEYPNDEPPETDQLQTLIEKLTDLSENFEEFEGNYIAKVSKGMNDETMTKEGIAKKEELINQAINEMETKKIEKVAKEYKVETNVEENTAEENVVLLFDKLRENKQPMPKNRFVKGDTVMSYNKVGNDYYIYKYNDKTKMLDDYDIVNSSSIGEYLKQQLKDGFKREQAETKQKTKIVENAVKDINELKEGDTFYRGTARKKYLGIKDNRVSYEELDGSTGSMPLDKFNELIKKGEIITKSQKLNTPNKEITQPRTETKVENKPTENKNTEEKTKTKSSKAKVETKVEEKTKPTETKKQKPKRELSLEKTKEIVSNHKEGEFYVRTTNGFEKVKGQIFEYNGRRFGYVKVKGKYEITELSTAMLVNSQGALSRLNIEPITSIDKMINFMYKSQNAIETAFGKASVSEAQKKLLDYQNSLLKQETKEKKAKPKEEAKTVKEEKKVEPKKEQVKTETLKVTKELQEARNLWEKTIKQEQDAISKPRAEVENYDERLETLAKVIKMFRKKYGLTDEAKFKEFLKIKPTIEAEQKNDTQKEVYALSTELFKETEEIAENEIKDPLEPNNYPAFLVREYGEWSRERVISVKDAKSMVKTLALVIANQYKFADTDEIRLNMSNVKVSQKLYEILMVEKGEKFNEALNEFVNAFVNIEIKSKKENGGEGLIVSKETLDREEVKEAIKQQLAEFINARAKMSKKAKTERYIEALKQRTKELRSAMREQAKLGNYSTQYRRLKDNMPSWLRNDTLVTRDNESYRQATALFQPLRLDRASGNGFMNGRNVYDGHGNATYVTMKSQIGELIGANQSGIIDPTQAIYRPVSFAQDGTIDTEKGGYSYFNLEIYNDFVDLYNSLEDGEGKLNASQLKKVIDLLKKVQKTTRHQQERIDNVIRPVATATIDGLRNKKAKNSALDSLRRTIIPAWQNIEYYLDSALSDEATWQLRQAKAKALNDTYKIALMENEFIDNNPTFNKDAKTIIKVGNVEIPAIVWAQTYGQLLFDEDVAQSIYENGLVYQDEKGFTKRINVQKEFANSQELFEFLKQQLPTSVKKYATFVGDLLNNNGKLHTDFATAYQTIYGLQYNEVNFKQGYFFSNRFIQTMRNGFGTQPILSIFGHAQERVRNSNPIIMKDLHESLFAYTDGLYKAIYVGPVYTDILDIMNTRIHYNGERINVATTIGEVYGDKVLKFITNTINSEVGVPNNTTKNILSRMFGFFVDGWTTATLASPATWFRQDMSKWVSLFSVGKIAQADIQLLDKSSEFAKLVDDYAQIIDEFYTRGGFEYKYTGNKNTFQIAKGKIKNIFTWGNKTFDKKALKTLLAASIKQTMAEGYNPYLDNGEKNPEFVKKLADIYSRAVLSQIGYDALSKGEGFETLRKIFIFSGPQFAAVGNLFDTIKLIGKYKGVAETSFDETIKQADYNIEIINEKMENSEEKVKSLLEEKEELKEEYLNDKEGYKEAKKQIDEEINKEQEKMFEYEDETAKERAKKSQAIHDKEEFRRYKTKGGSTGKVIGIAASQILILGLISTLISEINRRLKGKDEWDEVDGASLLKDVSYNLFLSWIPYVSTISNYLIGGYDVTIPTGEVLSNVVSSAKGIINIVGGNATDSDKKSMIRSMIDVITNSTGIPFKMAYDYVYGIIKTFDPEIALKYRSLLYNVTSQSATQTFNHYAEKDKTYRAKQQLSFIMDTYKLSSSETTNNELVRLAKDGYNALPKNYLTSYKDNEGNTVNLTKEQINAFRTEYNKASKVIDKLMNITDYKTKTSEEQAKIIKKIYDAYYSYAKAKVLKTDKADSKLSSLLLYTNGNLDVSRIVSVLDKISSITDSKNKTRKQLVFEYVNRLNISTEQKLLILNLAGYTSLSNNSKLYSYLQRLGVSKKNITAFLG